MEWTTVTITDEADLDLCVDEYQHNRAIQKFEDGELLTRACVFELHGCALALVWSLHHALTDHWALNSFESDIEDSYARRPLPPRRPFKPMIKYLEHLDRTAGLNFWRAHLQDATPTSFLQALPGAPRVIANDTVTREMDIEYSSLSRQFGIMPSTLVTCAWSLVLSAHSNCSDVVFGQILAGRSVCHSFHDSSSCSLLHQMHLSRTSVL